MSSKFLKVTLAACIAAAVVLASSCATTGPSVASGSTAPVAPANAVPLDAAITQAAAEVAAKVPAGSRVGITHFDSMSTAMSDYLFDELSDALVDAGLVVVDRDSLALVRKEQGFQTSGAVDDATAVTIGKIMGLKATMKGELLDVGTSLRMRVIAIDTESAKQLLAVHTTVIKDGNFTLLLNTLNSNTSYSKDANY